MNDTINKKIELLPNLPGCYLYKDIKGDIIYVGKAKNLKNRVRSYFTGSHNKKTQLLVSKINDLEFIIVNSEKESLLLENNLIKEHKPYYNIKLKDDKSYPYLMITKEKDPRIILTRKYRKKSKDMYFGPYVDIKSANDLKNIIDKIYPLRKCHPVSKRACTYYQIGECIGPCVRKIDESEYKKRISEIKNFLNGNVKETIDYLTEKMNYYSSKLEFENADKFYHYIKAINISIENQVISNNDDVDTDYIGYCYDENYLCVQIFLSRFGSIIERKVEYFDLYEDYESTLISFLIQYYTLNKNPKKIYIENINTKLLEDILDIKVIEPIRKNNKKIILDTLKNNAKFFLENQLLIEKEKEHHKIKILDHLAKKIGVDAISNIDAFDNSNIMGKDAVSVKVNFLNGEKNTYGYRKFKVKHNSGIDDIKTLKEVLFRNYKDKNTNTNLIIVDGGKNHVKAAIDVIHNELKLDIKIIGLAKNNKHITEYIVTDDFEMIYIDKNSPEYLFLKNIQDEVHRFAITYHRSLKVKNMFSSPLDNINGIGKERKKLLLENFSSLDDIKNAESHRLMAMGIPKKVIEELKTKL